MNALIRPVVARPPTRDDWNQVVADDPGALPEQTPEWTDAICDSGGYVDRSRFYEMPDGRRFVLPLVARTGPMGVGGQLWSFPPAWGIGGPAGRDLDAEAVTAITDDLRSLGAVRISLRIDPLDEPSWQHLDDRDIVRVRRRVHVLELESDPDVQFAALSKTSRRMIRRASDPSSGVEVQIGRGGELLDEHYHLFLRSARRWSKRQHEPLRLTLWRAQRRDPIVKLRAMAHHLGPRFVVVVGRCDGQLAASAITLLGPVARDTRGALDTDVAGRSGVNPLVQWTAIRLAADHGSTLFNMGESGWSEGVSWSKEQFGARPVEYHDYRFERLPFTTIDTAARRTVKRVIGFKD